MEEWDRNTRAEIRGLVEGLHLILVQGTPDNCVRCIGEDGLPADDDVLPSIERLRYLTDADYAECAYGCE